MKVHFGVDVKLYAFLISNLDGIRCSFHGLTIYMPGKMPSAFVGNGPEWVKERLQTERRKGKCQKTPAGN
jgi:hypothetical protein